MTTALAAAIAPHDGRHPLASRRAAVDVLMACLDKGQPLDDALGQHRGFAALDPRDRAFVRLLLASTLRHLGEIEGVLSGLITKPLEGANAVGRQVLRLGAAQLMFWERHRMPPSIPRCGWSRMPACITSRAW